MENNSFHLSPPQVFECVAAIKAGIANIPEQSRSFALSLTLKRYKWLTYKQMYWLDRMAKVAKGEQPAKPAPVAVGIAQADDMADVLALFAKAKAHLKHPKIVLSVPGTSLTIKLAVAGANAKRPGTINVTDDAPFGQGNWYGRITETGTFEQSGKCQPPAALVERLMAFARDPAAVAGEHGKLTGACCFCRKTLTTVESTSVGYGPDCAEHFGLPWGKGVGTPVLICTATA